MLAELVAMVTKTLKRKEVELGFVHIPAKNRAELMGDLPVPFDTKLNDLPAKVDKYGRLWSDYLKQRYPVDTQIALSRNNGGFQITAIEQKQDDIALEITKPIETVSPSIVLPENGIAHEVLEKRFPERITEAANIVPPEETTKIGNVKPYFHANSTWIFHDDIIKTGAIEKNSIDLIVTSPPYGVAVKYENYDDSIPYDQYLSFTRKWLERCHDFVKDDGRLCLNIPLDKNKGGQQSVYSDITQIAKEVGWKYHSTIVWNEQNMSRRTAWGSWLSASAPFVIAPVEVIVVLYKRVWRKMRKGKSDISKKEFIELTNGVWTFSGESKKRVGHPAPFPMELPKRCIKLFSYVGSTVLDPFLGSGTTLLACLETNRVGIGVEIDKNYCDLAIKRLKKSGLFQKKLTVHLEKTPQ